MSFYKKFEIKKPLYISIFTGIFTWSSIIIFTIFLFQFSPVRNFYYFFSRSFVNWDAIWYLKIATEGYDIIRKTVFFPLFPLLIKFFIIFIKDPVISGILISNLARIIGSIFFYNLIKDIYNERIAKISLMLWLLSPAGIFFINLYTESLFFMLTVMVFYFISKEKWFYASLLCGFITATKSIGGIVSFIFILEYIHFIFANNKRNRKHFTILFFLFLISFSGLFFYIIFLKYKFNDAFLFLHVHSKWHFRDHFVYPFYALFNRIINIKEYFSFTINEKKTIFSFLFTVLSIIFCFIGFKKVKFSHYIFLTGITIILSLQPLLMSNFRYFSGIFAFWLIFSIIIDKYIKNNISLYFIYLLFSISQIYINIRWIAGLWVG